MVHFVGASSLHNLLKAQPNNHKQQFASSVTTIRGLTFNPKSKDILKNLNFLLGSGKLRRVSGLVIWHDVLNNSVTSHPSNNYQPLSPDQLVEVLKKHRHRISALVYCKRFGAPSFEFKLREAGVLVIDVKRHLLSKRRRVTVSEDIQQVHPPVSLEWSLFSTIRAHSQNLHELVSRRGKRGRSKSLKSRRKSQKLHTQHSK